MRVIYTNEMITEKAYQQGIQDELNQNGYVPFVYILNNQTYQIKLILDIKNKLT